MNEKRILPLRITRKQSYELEFELERAELGESGSSVGYAVEHQLFNGFFNGQSEAQSKIMRRKTRERRGHPAPTFLIEMATLPSAR